MNIRICVYIASCLALAVLSVTSAAAGPPFLTDDPDPVPYHHWELYTFTTQDRTDGTSTVNGPALGLNNGVASNVQLHLIIPETHFSSNGMNGAGLGDIEGGVKYRFLTETKDRPEIGTFPLLEVPTGDAAKGLGNGRVWIKLPIWLEKNWGQWTSYWGGGYALNSAPRQRNFSFGGLLLQRTLNPKLSLGGEIFSQGAQAISASDSQSMDQIPGQRWSALWNVGGTYNFIPDFSLLFSAGHSFDGDGNTVVYVALYRTWGPGSP